MRLADHRAGVAGIPQSIREHSQVLSAADPVLDRAVDRRMNAGDQAASCRATDRRRRMSLCKHHTFTRHTVEMGGLGEVIAHAVERVAALSVSCD
jgi:hypothetical protein